MPGLLHLSVPGFSLVFTFQERSSARRIHSNWQNSLGNRLSMRAPSPFRYHDGEYIHGR